VAVTGLSGTVTTQDDQGAERIANDLISLCKLQ
jgi:hypothetical protein